MRTKNHLTNEFDWEEGHYPYGSTKSMTSTIRSSQQQQQQRSQYKSIFSDDEDDPIPVVPTNNTFSTITTTTMNMNNIMNNNNSGLPKWITPSAVSLTPSTTATYVDPLLSSGAYHIHQAENALSTLKHVIMEDGWKKALKHKSGVVVHMKNGLHKNDKTPIFKGEAIIQGFSPQSIFYVIGMRKLWDEQYEDGNLVENLNESTSLTYEITKPTATSKSRDFSLVERIECTQNGSIIFAATSVETPRIPRIHGRTRAQIKLQGWILEPIRGPIPSTKVTFVVQENMKGWVPGFAKKSLARRPLVIALINDYLQKKSDRMRTQQKSSLLSPYSHGYHHHSQQQQRPSIHTQLLDPSKNVSQRNSPTPSPTPSQRSILLGSNISTTSGKKRITFAEQNVTYPSSTNNNDEEMNHHHHHHHHQQQQERNIEVTSNPSIHAHNNNNLPLLTSNSPLSALSNSLIATSKSYQQQQQQQQQQQSIKSSSNRLYSVNRHSTKKLECLKLIKQLSNSPVGWTFMEEKNTTRFYSHQHYKLSRMDSVIFGGWTPEQLCSIINCVGAKKIWDHQFEHGEVVERFSQKDYLVKWRLKNNQQLTVISTIDTDTNIGAIYTASTSVKDDKIDSGSNDNNGDDDYTLQLYGWIFVPMKDSLGKQGVRVSVIMDTHLLHDQSNNNNNNNNNKNNNNSTVMNGLIQYINTYGCPPYIRRVAGKVINEHYSLENGYEMNYIVKHEASSSYKARKPNPEKSWCTDIRIDALKSYSLGFDLLITPSQGIRVELSETVVKIFTTMADLDGKQVSLKIYPSQLGKVTYNGTTMFYIKDNNNNNPIEKSINNNQASSSSSLSLATSSIKTNLSPSPQEDHSIKDEPSSPSPSLLPNIPSINEPFQEDHHHQQEDSDHEQSTTKSPHISFNQLQIPEGYMIVPQSHNNNNILILSDDLTFNGQQLAVMFLAMVICYYMGKFACQC